MMLTDEQEKEWRSIMEAGWPMTDEVCDRLIELEYIRAGIEPNEHVGGVSWHKAPIPFRWHRCRAQTRGLVGMFLAERCACGAARFDEKRWINKNSRSRSGRDG